MLDVKCIVAIVERGRADKVVDAAKRRCKGATIFYGRGTGETEANRFLKFHIESSKEIILILVEVDKCKRIMEAMVKAGDLKKPGTGIIFTLEVSDSIGLAIGRNLKNSIN